MECQERALEGLCSALEPELLPRCDVAAVHASLAHIVKLADGALVRLARRVESSGSFRDSGHASAADKIADVEGTSKAAAKAKISTSKRLEGLSETEEAVKEGRLSAEQAEAVADAAAADPESEPRLLGEAKRQSLPELREECRRTKAAADPGRDATARRLRAARCLRRFTDGEGAYNLRLRTTPQDGAAVDAVLAPLVDRLRADAKRAGCPDPVEALGADAVVEAIVGSADDGTRPSRAAESKVIALVAVDALRRGHTEGEERCELAGVGPVAVATIQAMLTDAFLALVVTDGVDVFTVAHAGRQVTAHQRTALQARGYRCEVPGCGARHNLEIDHTEDWSFTLRTALEHLGWLCKHHHALKTHSGYRLTGPVGNRVWRGPDGEPMAKRPT